MLDIRELHQNIVQLNDHYGYLKEGFDKFGKLMVSRFQSANSSRLGVKVLLKLDENYFDIKFLDRTFRFVFSTKINQKATLDGIVHCRSIDELNKKYIKIGEFSFDGNGRTTVGPVNNPLSLYDETASSYILLHYIYEGVIGDQGLQIDMSLALDEEEEE